MEEKADYMIGVFRYSGPYGAECVIDWQGDNWYGYAAASLDGAEYALSHGTAPASPSSFDAVIDALEGLIAWCSEQKEKGSKKHRKQAEEVQNWALDLVGKTRAEKQAANETPTPVTPEAPVEPVTVERLSVPAEARLHASATAQLFPLSRLHESPLNPRQYIPEASIEELASSMRQSGFRSWLPIVAQLRPDGDGNVAAGHRRRLAAIRAGLTEVPVVLQEMTDEEFLDVLNFDNTGREDVHPLHEAAGWRTWMEKTGKGVLDIAARIGQSKEYVYQRLKYADLIEEAREAFLDERITSSHAILIARLAPDDQRKALRACEPPMFDQEKKVSSRELAAWIKKNLHIDLTEAPFPCSSVELVPEAGSCIACPYRVGNAPGFDPSADLPDVCTRPSCYDEKLEAHIVAETERVQSQGGVLVSEGFSTRREGVLPQGAWHRCGESAQGTKPALIVEGASRGEAIFVLLQETLAFQQQPTAPPPKPKPQKAKKSAEEIERERQEREDFIEQQKRDEEKRLADERRRKAQIDLEKSVRQQILSAVLAKVSWPPKREEVLSLLEDVDMPEEVDEALESLGINPREWTRANTAKLSPANLAKLIVIVVVCGDLEEWTFSRGCDDLMAAAKRYGVNAARIRSDAEKKAAEAEGGTRKEVKPDDSSWTCGMCSHVSPARFKKNCQRCGAERGMGTRQSVVSKLPAMNEPKAKPAANKASKPAAKKPATKQAKKGGKK